MSRLTEKFEDNSGYTPIVNHPVRKEITLYDFEEEDYDCCVEKLGKLEDLEEELGCPLEVVFKAIEEGIIVKSVNDKFEGSTLWVDRPSFEKTLSDNEIMDFEEPRLIKCINWCFFVVVVVIEDVLD
jgi:hypothetical protein